MKIVQLLLCFFIPPVGTFLLKGAGKDLIINILLTLIGGLPGIIHAIYLWMKENKVL